MATDNFENFESASGTSTFKSAKSGIENLDGCDAKDGTVIPGERSLLEHCISRYAPESVQHLLACIVIDELVRLGIDPFIISPGMRAVPLFMALEGPLSRTVKKIPGKILVNDERSAGFFAAGMAKAGAFPCVICTSGTAVANYHPAVVEAWHSRIPMLILTTDRPWELLHAGANQTVNQKEMFRDCTVQSLDIPAPDTHIQVHSLLSAIDYLVARSRTGLRPVHLNLGFRKPFYQDGFNPLSALEGEDKDTLFRWLNKDSAYVNVRCTRSIRAPALPGNVSTSSSGTSTRRKKVVVIAGPSHSPHWECRSEAGSFTDTVLDKIKLLDVPVLTDIHSNMRQLDYPLLCAAHQWYLRAMTESGNIPDVVLYVGDRIVSTACQEFLQAVGRNPESRIIKFQTHSDREDAVENEFIPFTDVTPFLDEAFLMLPDTSEIDQEFSRFMLSQEKTARKKIHEILESEAVSERSYVRSLLSSLPAGTNVMLSASTIFREADYFAHEIPYGVRLYGNRGATGIDGIISTGIGLGSADEQGTPVLVLIGDQAALHDLTALSLLKNSRKPVVIAVVNNQGGALFNIVDKAAILPTLLNEHDLNFKSFAEGFGVTYHKVEQVDDAVVKMHNAFENGYHLLLEIPVDGKESAVNLNTIGE